MLEGRAGPWFTTFLGRQYAANPNESKESLGMEDESLLKSTDKNLVRYPTKKVQWASPNDGLPDSHDCKHEKYILSKSTKARSNSRLVTCLVVFICISMIMIWSIVACLISHRQFSCGDSIEEAKTRGCSFDPLNVTWLPHQCSRAATEEFLQANGNDTWHYYYNQGGSTEVYDLGSSLGDRIYWTTQGEHLTHCAYILIRAAEAAHSGQRTDHTSGAMHHTRHCALFLLENSKLSSHFNEVVTAGNVRLGGC